MGSVHSSFFGILLGWTSEYYPAVSRFSVDGIRMMVVQEHRPQRYHVRSFYLNCFEVQRF